MTTITDTLTAGASYGDFTSGGMTGIGTADDSLFFSDLPEAIRSLLLTLSDTATFDGPVAGNLEGGGAATSGASFADGSQAVTAMLMALADGIEFTEVMTPNAVLNAFLRDGLSILAIISIDGEEYVVWVANADTFAHAQYAHFNFNSMCRIGNRYYGANEQGVFLLDGEKDAGEDIRYFVTLPTTEFGHSGLKRIPRAYMGFTNAGDMHLKIITPEGQEIVYRFNPTSSGQTESLVKIGRGIVARYFTFDLYNYEGGDIELERIEFFPLYMRRLF